MIYYLTIIKFPWHKILVAVHVNSVDISRDKAQTYIVHIAYVFGKYPLQIGLNKLLVAAWLDAGMQFGDVSEVLQWDWAGH